MQQANIQSQEERHIDWISAGRDALDSHWITLAVVAIFVLVRIFGNRRKKMNDVLRKQRQNNYKKNCVDLVPISHESILPEEEGDKQRKQRRQMMIEDHLSQSLNNVDSLQIQNKLNKEMEELKIKEAKEKSTQFLVFKYLEVKRAMQQRKQAYKRVKQHDEEHRKKKQSIVNEMLKKQRENRNKQMLKMKNDKKQREKKIKQNQSKNKIKQIEQSQSDILKKSTEEGSSYLAFSSSSEKNQKQIKTTSAGSKANQPLLNLPQQKKQQQNQNKIIVFTVLKNKIGQIIQSKQNILTKQKQSQKKNINLKDSQQQCSLVIAQKLQDIICQKQQQTSQINLRQKKDTSVNITTTKLSKDQLIQKSKSYLQTLIDFAAKQKKSIQIKTTMSNLGGARSSLSNLFIFAKSFSQTIDRKKDNQLTTFALQIYESIVFKLILSSNIKSGIERIPPKSKSMQVEKNSINSYILIINIYKLMGMEKVWYIVVGKLLKLLQFCFNREEMLKSCDELELIANGYIKKKGEIEDKYLCRLDFLSYFLLGLISFDPLLIYRQNERDDEEVVKCRKQIQSWGVKWNYKQFWIFTNLIIRSNPQYYFKPILYMNIISVLYPRVLEHKHNPLSFKHQFQLCLDILKFSKSYYSSFRQNKQLLNLSQLLQKDEYVFDGDNFLMVLQVLQGRLLIQKEGELKLNRSDFEGKCNIFYYFNKQN